MEVKPMNNDEVILSVQIIANIAGARLDEAVEKLSSVTAAYEKLTDAIKKANDAATEPVPEQDKKATGGATEVNHVKTAVDALKPALSGVNAQIAGLVGHVSTLVSGLLKAGSTGASASSLVSSGWGVAAAAVGLMIGVFQDIKRKQEEAVATAKKATAAYDESLGSQRNLEQARHYLSILDAANSTVDEMADAKRALEGLFPNVAAGLYSEGEAIKYNTRALLAHIDALETENRLKQGRAAAGMSDLMKKAQEQAEEIENLRGQLNVKLSPKSAKELMDTLSTGNEDGSPTLFGQDPLNFMSGWLDPNTTKDEIAIKMEELYGTLQDTRTAFIAEVGEMFGPEVAKELTPDIYAMWTDLFKEYEKGALSEKDLFGTISNKQLGLENLNSLLAKTEKTVRKGLTYTLSAAILKAEEDMSDEAMEKLVSRTMEIDDQAIRTPAKGIMKQFKDALIYAFADTDIDESEAGGIINSLMAAFDDDEHFHQLLSEGNIGKIQDYLSESMRNLADAAGEEGSDAYNKIMDSLAPIANALTFMAKLTGVGLNTTPPPPRGGGARKNKALEREMDLLKHKKALDQLTAQEELEWLERIRKKYAKTTEEKRQLDEDIYKLRMQMRRDEIDYQREMDRLTLREEIAATEALLGAYKIGTEERKKLELDAYKLRKELEKQEFELAVHYGRLSLSEQAARLRAMIAQYRAGTQARIDLEKQLHDIQKTMVQNTIDGILAALEERYAAQRDLERETAEAGVEQWRRWADEQTKAIRAQIDALDELEQAEDRQAEEAEKRRKIASLEQQMAFESDADNRKKLQEQIAAAQEDLDAYLLRIQREDQRKALEAEIERIEEEAAAKEEALNEELNGIDAFYEELMKAANLNAEAQRMLTEGTQEEIIDLLKSYAPDYNITGRTLAEELMEGFIAGLESGGMSVEAWFGGIVDSFTQHQRELARLANEAADAFWASRGGGNADFGAQPSAAAVTAVNPASSIVVNFYQPIEKPSDVTRALEDLLESMHRQ
jgi:hypothetical protein